MKRFFNSLLVLVIMNVLLISCSSPDSAVTNDQNSTNGNATVVDTKLPSDSKGVGKFSKVETGQLNAENAEKGRLVFATKCSACHTTKINKLVGPGLKDVTKRRTPEWIMNMITNPMEMTKNDPVAKKLFEENLTQMTFQNVTDEDARFILEYLRQNDSIK